MSNSIANLVTFSGGSISDTHYRDCCTGRKEQESSPNTVTVRYYDLFSLATAADVTAAPATGESATIDGTTYYTAGSTFAIGYTGIVPANWNFSYVVTGGATLSGNTLTLASADATIAASVTPITYAVHFDANGGEGSMPDQTLSYDTPQALSSNVFTRTGYTFAGWSGVDGAIYPDRATVLNLTNAQDAVVSLTAQWTLNIPCIDADGTERICTDYTVLTDATGDVEYGEGGVESWYVVTNAVTISGQLYFNDVTAHLIICDGATLAVTNENGAAIEASSLAIYGQTNGTGTVAANGDKYGIFVGSGDLTINGGTVTANGGEYGDGIFASSKIILGWTNPTDSITASSYYARSGIYVKSDQRLTDGSKIYESGYNIIPFGLAGATLRPYIETPSFTDPEGREIEDAGLVGWLVANNFTQSDINALG